MPARIEHVREDLYQIILNPPLTGFDDFISAWLCTRGEAFLVDVGPAVTSADLLGALAQLGVQHLGHIFLTHIHIDHAGGVGEVARAFPAATVVCHPSGLPHLADPTRLWQGTLKVLGSLGAAYGPITPVEARRCVGTDQLRVPGVVPLATPGHAQNHVSYLSAGTLFVGEAAGVRLALADGREYRRPATPPRFFFDTYRQSLETLQRAGARDLCYGHHGFASGAAARLERHLHQLSVWRDVVAARMERFGRPGFRRACLTALLAADDWMVGLRSLPVAAQQREQTFLYNSIDGFAQYLKGVADDAQPL